MEQNIGQFIQELRKAKKMTQKELADIVGVSDKTISKWENGNSLPDTSILLSLCGVLDISVNELLSCEKLLKEEYSSKAEANMIKLLHEKEMSDKKNLVSLIIGVIVAIISLIFVYVINVGIDIKQMGYFVDFPSLICLTIMCIGLVLLSGVKKKSEILLVIKKIIIPAGVFIFIFSAIVVLEKMVSFEQFGPNLAIAIIPLLYAVLGYLILIPLTYRKA